MPRQTIALTFCPKGSEGAKWKDLPASVPVLQLEKNYLENQNSNKQKIPGRVLYTSCVQNIRSVAMVKQHFDLNKIKKS